MKSNISQDGKVAWVYFAQIYEMVRGIGLPFLLPCDVDQYYNKENSVLFSSHTIYKQTTSSRLSSRRLGPKAGPLSSYTSPPFVWEKWQVYMYIYSFIHIYLSDMHVVLKYTTKDRVPLYSGNSLDYCTNKASMNERSLFQFAGIQINRSHLAPDPS